MESIDRRFCRRLAKTRNWKFGIIRNIFPSQYKQILSKRIETYVFVKYRDPALSCVSSIFNLTFDVSYSRPSSGMEIGVITTILVRSVYKYIQRIKFTIKKNFWSGYISSVWSVCSHNKIFIHKTNRQCDCVYTVKFNLCECGFDVFGWRAEEFKKN